MPAVAACQAPATSLQPIFINGRAAAPEGDSLFAVTDPDRGVAFVDRHGRLRDSLGAAELLNPGKVQIVNNTVYVSDVENGRPRVLVFTRDGRLERRIDLDTLAGQPHQFAALPNGAIVVETPDQRLVALLDDSIYTFAVVERGPRPSLLVAADGGVLHAVPDRGITLYNGFGNTRWRIEWPWVESAYVSDVAIDSQGRVHVIVGSSSEETFTVQTLTREAGEIFRWSEPTTESTFVVSRAGQVTPAPERGHHLTGERN